MPFTGVDPDAQAVAFARRLRHGEAEPSRVVGVPLQQFLAVHRVKDGNQAVLDRRTAVEAAFHNHVAAFQPGEDIDPVGQGRCRSQQRRGQHGQQQKR